jgi:enoyl-CoA hydratase/carnithine racemase
MLDVIEHGDVAELSLNRPPANALTIEVLDICLDKFSEVVNDGARGVVLSGREGMFSAGLDVPVLLPQGREEIEEFWTHFFSLLELIAGSSVPVGAAITGHAPAGGMVMALYCDFRIATSGDYKMGLNEVQVGLPVPRNVLFALESVIGPRHAAWYASAGELIGPEEALAVGLVDRLADNPAAAVAQAIERLEHLLSLPQLAMNRTRVAAKSALLEKTAEASNYVRLAVDAWFGDEAQEMMQHMVEKLGSK